MLISDSECVHAYVHTYVCVCVLGVCFEIIQSEDHVSYHGVQVRIYEKLSFLSLLLI